ncbi:hypothetical protein PT974_01339 [Cladobotryum mycophilum]|uniref:F-box domain-containing protein n=1 Tax=Cladobotryum mycophilum TaxID=491253 RepID=A0ABR0T4H6_9HYPO
MSAFLSPLSSCSSSRSSHFSTPERTPVSLLDLKNGIILTIVQYLDRDRDVHALSKVNRRLFELLNDELYLLNAMYYKASALVWTTKTGRLQRTKQILGFECIVNTATLDIWRLAFRLSVENGQKETVELLMKHDPIQTGLASNTSTFEPLLWAVGGKQLGLLKDLLKALLPSITMNKLLDALHYATHRGQHEAEQLLLNSLRTLLSSGQVDANDGNFLGRTPLIQACMSCSANVVDVLLSSGGAHPNRGDISGKTPLMHLLSELECFEGKFMHYSAEYVIGVKRGALSIIRQLLLATARIDLQARDRDGVNVLMYAIRTGVFESVAALLGAHSLEERTHLLFTFVALVQSIAGAAQGQVSIPAR